MPEETAYEIRIRSVLDEKWIPFFAPFTLVVCGDESLLTGTAQDQSELFGILLKIRDLGLSLVSVTPGDPGGEVCRPGQQP